MSKHNDHPARRLWTGAAVPFLLMIAFLVTSTPAQADVNAETAFVFGTLSFLVHGFLVFWMAAGFAMLEAGLVRTKSVTTILLKNISLFSIAGISYFLVGYGLMYQGVDGGFFGSFEMWHADDSAALAGDYSVGHAASSDWFFQMVFVATAASIVSGALAERIKLWPFLVFILVMTMIIYPVQGAWHWGGGWLATLGFRDFAGSTLVHSVGGWAALTGAVILGPRRGRYGADGGVRPLPGSSLPLATLGTFILWLGWLGFNGGSQLSLGSASDAIAIANIYVNTTIASAGAAGGAMVVVFTPLLDRLKVDDVVGAIPVHLIAGVWGTMVVPLTDPGASYLVQAVGVCAVGIFVATLSATVWLVLRTCVGIRLTEVGEALGIDEVETGMRAYPEFEIATHIR